MKTLLAARIPYMLAFLAAALGIVWLYWARTRGGDNNNS
jgi:hypothetical protein